MTLHTVGSLGIAATLAAWTAEGDAWLAACLAELLANRDHLLQRVATDLPGVRCRAPEATFLAWLDCRDHGPGRRTGAPVPPRGAGRPVAGPRLRRARPGPRPAELRHQPAGPRRDPRPHGRPPLSDFCN